MDATSRLNRGQNPLRRLGAEYDPKSHQNRMEMNRPPLPTHVCPIVGNIKTYQLNRYLRHTPRAPNWANRTNRVNEEMSVLTYLFSYVCVCFQRLA